MSEDSGKLQSDRLFKGLTRPAMVFGVSFPFAFFNITGNFMFYVFNESLFTLGASLVFVHCVGYLICHKEPLFMELFLIKMQKCTVCRNKLYHGGNSYDVD